MASCRSGSFVTNFRVRSIGPLRAQGSHVILVTHKRAPHGRRHSPAPMLRVGQGSTSTRKKENACRAVRFGIIEL